MRRGREGQMTKYPDGKMTDIPSPVILPLKLANGSFRPVFLLLYIHIHPRQIRVAVDAIFGGAQPTQI